MISTKNAKTKVFVEEYRGNETFSIWPVDDKGEKIGSFPILSVGKKKADSIMKHLKELKEFLGVKE